MALTADQARDPWPRLPLVRTALAVAAMVVAVLVATLLVGLVPGRDLAPTSTVLSILSGDVMVQPFRDASARGAADGEPLSAGMTVRTAEPGGRAVLTFREGSTLEIEPGTIVSIEELSIGARGELIVRLGQGRGRTWAYVQPLLSANSRFMVTTPSATAVARGTSFEVDVTEAGAGAVTTDVSVFQGQVDVVAAGTVRPVMASQTTRVAQGAAPEPTRRLDASQNCVRLALSSSAMMIVTDPGGRSAGQTRMSSVSQIPRSTITGPQAQVQLIDVFSPTAGTWEIGIVPRGDGGGFELEVTSVIGARARTTRTLTSIVQPGQQLVTRIVVGHDGGVEAFEALQQTSRTRAKIVDVAGTTTAYLPGARAFAPGSAAQPFSCAG